MSTVLSVAHLNPADRLVGASTSLVLLLTGAAAVVTWAAAWPLLIWLKKRQLGKAIRLDGPAHGAKAGTPTMGGLAMLLGLAAAGALGIANRPAWLSDPDTVTLLLAVLLFGLLGLVDDLQGLARRSLGRELGVGLTARRALLLQAVAALAIAWRIGPERVLQVPGELLAARGAGTGAVASVPGNPMSPLLAGLGMTIAALTILGTVNGTNIADGLDGLAAGLAAIALGGTALASSWLHAAAQQTRAPLVVNWPLPAVTAVAAAGSCLGFLYWNRYPARLFMGNVGSLTLGAVLATTTLQTGTWWLLPVFGAVLVAEVVSDLLQVAYFKATRGRRLFRMAPLHHHFELGGIAEPRVVRWFWLAGCLAASAGLAVAHYLSFASSSPLGR